MISNNPKNILLADDSVFFRTKFSTILIEAGHRVAFARDGREVINKIEENPDDIDLLILDLQMPHVDGFGVLDWMKENGYSGRFPILIITGVYEPGEVMDRLKSLGASCLMTKGYTPEQVIHRIHRILFPHRVDERVEPRAPVSAAVDFSLGDKTHTGFLLNISATGLFLNTRMELLSGSAVELKFSLPDSDKVFDVKGTVRWSTPSSASKSLFGGSGIMFTSIADEDKQELRNWAIEENKRLDIDI
jgi:uncharacterized protein (TIGR02266 family)